MTSKEIILSMSEEQAMRISPVVRAVKAGDLEGAKAIMDGLTVEELDLLIALLEDVVAEREAVTV